MYLIVANFHVYVSDGTDPATGKPRPDKKVSFFKGRVIEPDKIPEGQSGDDWVDKGLAELAKPSTGAGITEPPAE
jgi:hypothetical protein